MELELLSTTVVVLADEHNPTILHPAFLAAEGVVPKDWQPGEPPICTPAFSIVKYPNGISFVVESNRLSVSEEKPAGNPTVSQIAALVTAYVSKLPHVRYKAVGINFRGYCSCEAPEKFLIDRFLKAGEWNSLAHPMSALGTRFAYHVDQAILRIGIDGGVVLQEGQQEQAILLTGNFHSDLPTSQPVKALDVLVSQWPGRLSSFKDLSTIILGLKDV